MATNEVATPYDTARLLYGGNVQSWLNSYDAQRLASYATYEDIYWNRPETFKLMMRGTNEHPIYLPSGRIIVNTMNRYVGRGFTWVADPTLGTPEQRTLIVQAFESMFRRERFRSQFNTNKLYGLIRGDACWYITANSDKPEGTRIKIEHIDPATVFWIEDEDHPGNVLGVDIVQQVAKGDTLYVERQRYLKSNHPDHPEFTDPPTFDGEISYQLDSFEVEGWEDPETQKKFVEGDSIPAEIIPGITKLPVYHWKNFDEPENPWGSSEMRGLETVFGGINQAVSDQDLALAIAGLGTYVTNAGPPVDESGNPVAWGLGPAEVVELGGTKSDTYFERIQGITSVTPSLEHINMLEDRAFRVSGASDVAQGRVDVQVAESGIALELRMGPILDEAAIKDQLILDCMNQMFFDLRQWYDVYEGEDFGAETGAVLVGAVGPKLPENKKQRAADLLAGYQTIPPLFSAAYVRAEYRRMGWEMPDDTEMQKQIAEEMEFFGSMEAGDGAGFGGRLEEESAEEEV